jgi:hypothetical protein
MAELTAAATNLPKINRLFRRVIDGVTGACLIRAVVARSPKATMWATHKSVSAIANAEGNKYARNGMV